MNISVEELAGCGTTSAALSFGGYSGVGTFVSETEIWDGAIWTITNALNVARNNLAGSGTTLKALSFGGQEVSTLGTTEVWSGASWATTSSLNVPREQFAGSGTGYDALSFGGFAGVIKNATEIWGSFYVGTWTLTSSLNFEEYGSCAFGNTIDAIVSGGRIPDTWQRPYTEKWNGVSWTLTGSPNIMSYLVSGVGNTSSGLRFGGIGSVNLRNETEQWNGFSWSTTSTLNVAKDAIAGSGDSLDALCSGGYTGTTLNETEKWNGSQEYPQEVINITKIIQGTEVIPIQKIVYGTKVIHKTLDLSKYTIYDNKQDFSEWETKSGLAGFLVIVTDEKDKKVYGFLGEIEASFNEINVYKDKSLNTSGWLGEESEFNFNSSRLTYVIKKSTFDIADLFSQKPLRKGSDGSLLSYGVLSTSSALSLLSKGYSGELDEDVLNENIYYDLVFDAGYPSEIKDEIAALCESREDCIAILDNTDTKSRSESLSERKNHQDYNSKYVSIFEPYTKIYDIYTGKDVWVSPTYHVSNIFAKNDSVGDQFLAAAGINRGSIDGIKDARWIANKSDRDILYQNQINPIIKTSFGYNLWTQLTSQSNASALQDINIVRLYLYVKKGVKQYLELNVFEDNDLQTLSNVKNNIVEFLENIKKRRGLFSYEIDVGTTKQELKNKTFHVNIKLGTLKTIEKIEMNLSIK